MLTANVADVAEATRACDGAAVVQPTALNPPYAKWPELHPPLMKAIIEGAASAGSTLIFGDNLYAYGTADVPLTDGSALSGSRREREDARPDRRRPDEGARRGPGPRASIGRASDFFGPDVLQSTVGERVFSRALAGKPARVLGDPDAFTPSPISRTSGGRW